MSNSNRVTDITQIETGVVKVEAKCQRGSGTNDRDTVKAYAYFATIEEAEDHEGELAHLAANELRILRTVDEDGIVAEDVEESSVGQFEDFKVDRET